MKHSKGFTLFEIVLSLTVFSFLFMVYFKWEVVMSHQRALLSEQENLPVYVNAFLHFMETVSECWNVNVNVDARCFREKALVWYAFQEKETKVRKFGMEKPLRYQFRIEVTLAKEESSQNESGIMVEFYGKFYQEPLWIFYVPIFPNATKDAMEIFNKLWDILIKNVIKRGN